ncbi:uncharacterized protein ACNLHF_005390 isoform 1-T3 [Anomaloglossus baeobatrachus]|uniref:uncharacterized protein LOC142280628 n=1 Tax=Anomaloglossus baeobatrachus TaxID=238106 RepID=UPI003F5063B1
MYHGLNHFVLTMCRCMLLITCLVFFSVFSTGCSATRMDYKAFETTWLNQVDRVFGGTGSISQQDSAQGLDAAFSDIQRLSIKRTRLWWNRVLLEQYVARKLIPRGLRIRVTPTFLVDDETFIEKWESACNLCSSTLMNLLIDFDNTSLTKLDQTLDVKLSEFRAKCSPDQLKEYEDRMAKKIEGCVKNIHHTQMAKISRDQSDFNLKSVYAWKRASDPSGASERTNSMSSTGSLGGVSDASTSSMNTRSGARYGGGAPGGSGVRHYQSGYRRDNKVLNLSTHKLSTTDLRLLERGLSFSPASGFDLFSTIKDLHIFARSVLFKKYFFDDALHTLFPTEEEQDALRVLHELSIEHNLPIGGKIPPSIVRRSKKFPPLSTCTNVDMFVRVVSQELESISPRIIKDNLTRPERERLRELTSLSDVVLKPADKGGNVVVWPTSLYEREAFRQLNNTVCYKKLTFNPLSSFNIQLNKILIRAKDDGIISSELASALQVAEPTIATLYLLPKIHKNCDTPPGRPIISGRGNFLENVNKWIDSILQPLVGSLPSYIQDTGDFLRKVDGLFAGEDTLLVAGDVESLYTSIVHSDGLRAAKFFLDTTSNPPDFNELVLRLLEFSLTHHFFTFKGSFYLQLQGTAMGASFAPAYANLFLGLWERDLPLSDRESLMDRVLLWARYIDDIFLIWQGSLVELHQFMSVLNSSGRNILITYQWSHEQVEFLDVLVRKDAEFVLQTDLYRKPTSTNTLLHASSAHPQYMIRSVPTGQFLRLRRICSTNADFERQSLDLMERFRERGYSRRMIKRAYHRAKYSCRDNLLYSDSVPGPSNQVRFITNYSSGFDLVRSSLEHAWPILMADPTLKKVLPSKPQITIRRSKNFRDLLVHSHYAVTNKDRTFLGSMGHTNRSGCSPCGGCVACPNICRGNTFSDSSGNRSFYIKKSITCTSRAVIYYATCPCPKIYVGLTTRQLKVRVREHVLGIEAAPSQVDKTTLKTIPKHFLIHHGSDSTQFRVLGIDQIDLGIRGGEVSRRLAQLEARWIYRLNTVCPSGLNENLSFASFL